MRKNLLVFILGVVMASSYTFVSYGQTNLLQNSNFETQGAWKVAQRNLSHTYEVDFGTAAAGINGGSGKCLEILYDASAGGSGEIEVFVYQKVDVTKGHTYKFSCAMKDASSVISDGWIEIFWYADTISDERSIPENSVGKYGTWQACNGVGFNGLIDTSCATYNASSVAHPYFTVPDTIAGDTIYVGINIGTWGITANFDLYFDNLTLVDSAEGPSGILQVNNNDKPFDLYPNLSDGQVKLTSKTATPAYYRIYSVLGAVVKEGRFMRSEILELNSLKKGIYIVKLEGEGKSYTSKLILK